MIRNKKEPEQEHHYPALGSVLFLTLEQLGTAGSVTPCIKIGRAWVVLGGQGEPLGTSTCIHPNQIWREQIQTLSPVYWNHVSRDLGFCVHACF